MYAASKLFWQLPLAELSADQDEDRSSVEGCDSSADASLSPAISNSSGGEEVRSPPQGADSRKSPTTTSGSLAETLTSEKPSQSYMALISMAILNAPQRRLLLGDIYKYIADKFPYYRDVEDKAWKNSVRHNLSLNECFIKSGRADNGKGHYWGIHAACVDDFRRGDFRRRQARRRAKRGVLQTLEQAEGACARLASAPAASSYYPSAMPAFAYPNPYNMGYVPMTSVPTGMSLPPRYPHLNATYGSLTTPLTTPMTSLQAVAPAMTPGYSAGNYTQQVTSPMTSASPMTYFPATSYAPHLTSSTPISNQQPFTTAHSAIVARDQLSRASYSGYLQSHPALGAPPNVTATQLGSYGSLFPSFPVSMTTPRMDSLIAIANCLS